MVTLPKPVIELSNAELEQLILAVVKSVVDTKLNAIEKKLDALIKKLEKTN